jgi:ribosomal protein L11 methyltransferase
MRTWPAIDVELGRLTATSTTDAVGAGFSRPDLFQAALTDYPVAAIDDAEADRWRVFFHAAAERDRALEGLRRSFPALPLASIDVPDEDWAARSQANLRAVRIGNIVVAPPWDVGDLGSGIGDRGSGIRDQEPGTTNTDPRSHIPDPNSITIIIQPPMGFGTGHHATTRLCLAALQQINVRERTVLDVGTGSGVLAIAARMLGAMEVMAIDDDEDAIASAGENLALNRTAHVALQVASVERVVFAPFDVVLANLTGGLLMHTADALERLVTPAGRLIISGFTQSEEVGVLGAFRELRVVDRMQEEEWMCATLQREGAFA